MTGQNMRYAPQTVVLLRRLFILALSLISGGQAVIWSIRYAVPLHYPALASLFGLLLTIVLKRAGRRSAARWALGVLVGCTYVTSLALVLIPSRVSSHPLLPITTISGLVCGLSAGLAVATWKPGATGLDSGTLADKNGELKAHPVTSVLAYTIGGVMLASVVVSHWVPETLQARLPWMTLGVIFIASIAVLVLARTRGA